MSGITKVSSSLGGGYVGEEEITYYSVLLDHILRLEEIRTK